MKKGCLIAVGVAVGFAALIAAIFFLVFVLTRGVADAGNDFLARIGSGKIKEAYESGSATLKSQQTEEEFEATVKKLGLGDYASASWSNRNFENDQGTLEGSVTTRSGGKIPLHVDLIKESGVWKVSSLNLLGAAPSLEPTDGKPGPLGVAEPKAGKPAPPDDKLKALALETLLAFDKGVKGKDFTALRERGTSAFRENLSAGKLLEAFQIFIDHKIDLSHIEKLQPTFDPPPAIDASDVLT